MKEYPLAVRVLIVVATIWFGLNTGVLTFNLINQWWVAAIQSPGMIQQEKNRADALQRQLEAERAKSKPSPEPEKK